jgi:hypothetical protein
MVLDYKWIGDWADVPPATAHAHHGLTMLSDGTVLSGHSQEPKCMILSPEGKMLRELHSPHGVCADEDGNIYVSEWLPGDRFIKLQRVQNAVD